MKSGGSAVRSEGLASVLDVRFLIWFISDMHDIHNVLINPLLLMLEYRIQVL